MFSSATIGDPARLASELCGLPVVAVTEDGSPRAERLFALWNPPLLDADTGARASTNVEVARLTAALVEGGWRTVAFCRSRRGTEVVAADVRRRLPEPLAEAVRSYRAGYLAAERREIEAELFAGRVQGVVATSALELGVDIGGLDACVLNGFPGTIASMWQQAGRAGRGEGTSVAVLVAGADQLDQWLMAHPREVFTRPPEPAVVNLSNPSVLLPQLACAAYEQPLTPADEAWWGDAVDDGVRAARPGRAGSGCATVSPTGAAGAHRRPGSACAPAPPTSSASPRPTAGWSARSTAAGRSSRSTRARSTCTSASSTGWLELDLADRVAHVEPVDVDEYTQVRSEHDGDRSSAPTPARAVGRCRGGARGRGDRHPGRGL